MVNRLFIILLFFIAYASHATEYPIRKPPQRLDDDPEKKEYYWLSPRVSVLIPNSIANKSLKKSFAGVYELGAGLNVMVFKGLFIGANYKTGEYKLKGVTGQAAFDYNPVMKLNKAGIKVGGDKFIGDRNKIIFSAAVTLGRNWTAFKGLRCVDTTMSPKINSFSTTFIEPEINLYFLIENNVGIGATISYTMVNKIFEPKELCLDDWQAYGKTGSSPMQFINFGFGIYYSFLKKKRQ